MSTAFRLVLLLAGLFFAASALAQGVPAAPPAGLGAKFTPSAATVECYDYLEIKLELAAGVAPKSNPFTDASFTGTFTFAAAKVNDAGAHSADAPKAGAQTEVEGFCDSADRSVFRIRFMPSRAGAYSYALRYRQPGAAEATFSGQFTATATRQPGILRVDPDHPWHFIWEGTGQHCFVNGTTVFFLMGWQDDRTIDSILDCLHDLDINRIRILLDGRSDHTWTEPIKDTPQFHTYLNPWQAQRPEDIGNPGFDFARFNPAYWQRYERMMTYARDKGIVVSTIFLWNDDKAHPAAGSEDERRYFRYAVDRLAAFSNVSWDLGDDLDSFRDEKWTHDTGTFLHSIDPYHHLATSHPVNNDHQDRASAWFSMTSFQEWHRPLHGWMVEQRDKQAKTGRIIPQMNEEYGYEDHYPSWAPYKSPAADADGDRRAAWGISMAGCYQTTGETAKRGTGVPPDTGGGWVNGRGDKTMTMLVGYATMVHFFESVEWWKANPHDAIVSNGAMCLAAPAEFYIVYLPHGGGTTLDMKLEADPAKARYAAQWFNPRTGAYTGIDKLSEGPAWTSPQAPDKEDWALLLKKSP